MTAPTTDGQPSLPRRTGPKGLLPSTWLERTLKLEYVVCGELRPTEVTLLDLFPAGPIVLAGGARQRSLASSSEGGPLQGGGA